MNVTDIHHIQRWNWDSLLAPSRTHDAHGRKQVLELVILSILK